MANGLVEVYKTVDPIPCTVAAGGTVTAGRLVRLTGAGSYVVATAGAAADDVLGVAQTDGDGDNVDANRVGVVISGVAELTAAGAIDEGDMVIAAATGKVSVVGAAAAADARTIIGQAMTAAAADNDKIEVLLKLS
jgi:hypothetical protein